MLVSVLVSAAAILNWEEYRIVKDHRLVSFDRSSSLTETSLVAHVEVHKTCSGVEQPLIAFYVFSFYVLLTHNSNNVLFCRFF